VKIKKIKKKTPINKKNGTKTKLTESQDEIKRLLELGAN
jgi:hypothetical protein